MGELYCFGWIVKGLVLPRCVGWVVKDLMEGVLYGGLLWVLCLRTSPDSEEGPLGWDPRGYAPLGPPPPELVSS